MKPEEEKVTENDFRVAEIAARLLKNGNIFVAVKDARALIAEVVDQRLISVNQAKLVQRQAEENDDVYTFDDAVKSMTRCFGIAGARKKFCEYLQLVGREGGNEHFGFKRRREAPAAYVDRILVEFEDRLFGIFTVGFWRMDYVRRFPKREGKKDKTLILTLSEMNKKARRKEMLPSVPNKTVNRASKAG